MAKSYLMDIGERLEATGLKNKNLEFLSDLTVEQFMALFESAAMLEPFSRTGLTLMQGRNLCSLFFQPSTRTRFSTEVAMQRLGGTVVTESSPAQNSSAAKGESLADHLITASCYSNVIALRHPDYDVVREALSYARVPVISCGWGNETHPTQGLLDLYTAYRTCGQSFEGLHVCLASPDLSRGRAAHSFAQGLARLGAQVTYFGLSSLPIPEIVKQKLNSLSGNVQVINDGSHQDFLDLLSQCDLCYFPGCCVPKDNPAARDDFLRSIKPFYLTLDECKKLSSGRQRPLGVMHALPRNSCEFDLAIDHSEHELYFKQMAYSVPIRMAIIAAQIGL